MFDELLCVNEGFVWLEKSPHLQRTNGSQPLKVGLFSSAECGLGSDWLQLLPVHVVGTVVAEVCLCLCMLGAEVMIAAERSVSDPG